MVKTLPDGRTVISRPSDDRGSGTGGTIEVQSLEKKSAEDKFRY